MSKQDSFFSKVHERMNTYETLLCAGIDPSDSDVRNFHHKKGEDVLNEQDIVTYCCNIIDKTRNFICCIKPNVAYFQVFGAEGASALKHVCEYSHSVGIPVLLDCKVGDIGSTASAYAKSIYDYYKADATTLNAYMGRDTIMPFVANGQGAAFVVCKTSNPSSNDVQTMKAYNGTPVYMQIASLCHQICCEMETETYEGPIGVVVGATDTEAVAAVRQQFPRIWILAPGVGAQGGDLTTTINNGIRNDNRGIIIPVSRGITSSDDLASAAEYFRDEINKAIKIRANN